MRMDKFTARFQAGLADAQSLAVGRDHATLEPAHLMLALLDQQGGTVRPLLDKTGPHCVRASAPHWIVCPRWRERLATSVFPMTSTGC
jgi:hypothetical protein